MQKIRMLISLFALIAIWMPVTTLAIGVSATPATLSVKVGSGKEGIARFIVSNPSKEVGLFEVYPEEFEESFTLVPSRFVLEAGERREVLARVRRREEGIIHTAIAIEAQPLGEPALGVGGGVRLPLSVEVTKTNSQLAAVFGSSFAPWLALVCIVILFLLVFQRDMFKRILSRIVRIK